MSTNRNQERTDPHDDEPVDAIAVRAFSGEIVRTVPAVGSPIGLLGLAQTALDDLMAVGNPGEVDPMDLDGAFVAHRLAEYGVTGLPGSSLMHPVVEHVLRYTDAEQVRLVGDGRALSISKFGITAIVELPAAVAEFVELYDGPQPFPHPGLYVRIDARAS